MTAHFAGTVCILLAAEIYPLLARRPELYIMARIYTLAAHLLIRACWDIFPVIMPISVFDPVFNHWWGSSTPSSQSRTSSGSPGSSTPERPPCPSAGAVPVRLTSTATRKRCAVWKRTGTCRTARARTTSLGSCSPPRSRALPSRRVLPPREMREG